MITTFADLSGNQKVAGELARLLAAGRLPAAVILEGPAGSGKTHVARLLASGLLCQNHQNRPCGLCDACRLVQAGHPDVLWLQPAKDKAAVSVDEIRTLRSEAFLRPNQGTGRVFVVQKVNPAGQNALLKVLEEPPAGVTFILLCHHAGEWLDTVRSRCVVFSLEPLEKTQLPEVCSTLAHALCNNRPCDFLTAVTPFTAERGTHVPMLEGLLALIRDALAGTPESVMARRLTPEVLLQLASVIKQEQPKLNYNPNGNLFFTTLCAKLFACLGRS